MNALNLPSSIGRETLSERDNVITSRVHRRSVSDGLRITPYPSSCIAKTGEESSAVTTETRQLSDENTRPRAVIDCAICQGPLTDPALGGGCAHHFCMACYSDWCARGKNNCPTCRAPVWCLTRDTEFAEIVDPDSLSNPSSPAQRASSIPGGEDSVLSFAIAAPAGVTLSNDASMRGCLVTRVVSHNGAACAGVRPGDIVLKVNGTPVSEHSMAIEMIERRARIGDLELQVLRASKQPSVKRIAAALSAVVARLPRAATSPISPAASRTRLVPHEMVAAP